MRPHVDYGFASCGCPGCVGIYQAVAQAKILEGTTMAESPGYRYAQDILAALGTIRQDVRSLIAAVARLEGIVRPEPSGEPWCNIEGCNCHPKPPADLS